MLNFKNLSLLFVCTVVLLSILRVNYAFSTWIFVLVAFLYFILLVIGSTRISSNFFMPVICNQSNSGNQIALSFDDGPALNTTGKILDILKQNQVPATFFCIGKNVKEHPVLVERIDKEGHLIGNHSYSHHFFFDLFSSSRISEELIETNRLTRDIIHKEMRLFRPPYGVTTPNIATAVKNNKFINIGWNIRSLDTILDDQERILNRSLNRLKPGDIILFHDTMDVTVCILQELIDRVRQKGFQIVRIDQLLNVRAYD